MAVIRTYSELLSALEALPSPAAGRLRVYRGQNRDFGSMKPTALRGVRDREQVWRIFSHRLAHAFAPDLAGQNVDLDLILLWLRAIKQHYGPGTEFLDVTHSPGIGAWFALHAMRYETAQITYGPPGPFDPHRDVIGLHELVEHARYEEPAVLYVIDAVKGSGPSDLQHGTVFDLALAPEPFSTSPRIRAQQGCLVYANADVDGGDLSSLYVPGTPLVIGWPLSGCAEVLAAPDEIFPDINQDEWYRRFVSIPLMPAVGKSEQATIYEHPIRISLYEPQSATYELDHERLDALTERFVVQQPALVYAALRTEGFDADQVPALSGRFASATALLMEGPMMTTIPPVDRINLGVLLEDRTSDAPRWDVVTGATIEDADLTNVFVELSTVDRDGWERAETDMDFETVRGIWLIS
ncbi:MAG TPA: FRG domain-containing protein, partial [Chloroflexota bacterium]